MAVWTGGTARRAVARAAAACALAAACGMGLAGCAQQAGQDAAASDPVVNTADLSGGVAATVGDVQIGENAVTAYIASFRNSQGLENDDDWGTWLVDYGYTVDSIRGDTLDMYVNQELVRQAAASEGVEVEESAVDEYVQQARDQYDSDEAWQQTLSDGGMTEEAYRATVRISLLQQALTEKVAPGTAVSDEEVLEYVTTYSADYKEAASLDEVPEDVVTRYREYADSVAQQKAFSEWMSAFKEGVEVTEEMKPEGLPYDIDLTPYEQAALSAAQEVQDAQESAEAAGDGTAE